jgi:uncharacterized protein (TIGR02996 family)
MAEHPDLEAAIFAAPDELAGYERYGRWLEERGDPRAALILRQCARERDRAVQIGLDGWDRQNAELAAMLTPARSRVAGGGISWRRGFVERIALAISQQPTDELRAELIALLAHPHLRFLRELSLVASFPERPEVDFGWVFDLIAERHPLPLLEWVYVWGARVISYQALARVLQRPARLGSDCRVTRYPGCYRHVRALDLRDELLEWSDGSWPDLERLTLRPRGNPTRSVAWAGAVLAAAPSFPRVRELRLLERADDVLAHLFSSPLLPQLTTLDCTSSITNRGAELLYAHVDQLTHLDEIWLGSDDRRTSLQRDLPRGTLEIDDAWRSRLKGRLGRKLRFKVRPRLMEL